MLFWMFHVFASLGCTMRREFHALQCPMRTATNTELRHWLCKVFKLRHCWIKELKNAKRSILRARWSDCNRDGSIASNATLMVFYFIFQQLGAKKFCKKCQFLYLSFGTPHLLLRNIHDFSHFLSSLRSFFVIVISRVFAIFGSLFYETALVIALLHRLVYRFVKPLRYTSHRLNKVLKRLYNVSVGSWLLSQMFHFRKYWKPSKQLRRMWDCIIAAGSS